MAQMDPQQLMMMIQQLLHSGPGGPGGAMPGAGPSPMFGGPAGGPQGPPMHAAGPGAPDEHEPPKGPAEPGKPAVQRRVPKAGPARKPF